MNCSSLLVAALVAAFPLIAQEGKPAPTKDDHGAQADPKTKEHDALKAFVGTWDLTHKITPPGATAPVESKGTENAELICNGLYLKSTINGEHDGKPMQGVMILGFDPYKKAYTGIWVDNEEGHAPCQSEGRYDAITKTWSFTGTMKGGPFTSTLVFKDADNIVENCTGMDNGKEVKAEIVRTRSKGARAVPSAARGESKPSKEREALLKTVGDWDAVMKMSPTPGTPPQDTPATETVVAICADHYVWTDFRMLLQGKPFEGHGLFGYDSEQKHYVSYWLDSMSPTISSSRGTVDASGKTTTMTGTSRDHQGKPATTTETCTWKDDNTRVMTMESKSENGTNSFEITFKRKARQ